MMMGSVNSRREAIIQFAVLGENNFLGARSLAT